MRKKIFTLFLALVASVGTLFAQSGSCGDNLKWDLTDGVLTISGTGAMNDFPYPSKIPWDSYSSSIKSAIINDGVTCIGENAFIACTSMTSVAIPNSVTCIGSSAFWRCISLTSVTIPNSVTSIGDHAFWDCIGLTSVTIPNSVTSIGEWAFGEVPNIVYSGTATGSPWGARSVNGFVEGWLVYSDNTKTHLLACFAAVTGEITIPSTVTSIGNGTFYECSGLTSIMIPNSVTSIGGSAFSGCSGLTSIEIPNSVTSIGQMAFYGCKGLTSVTIPNSVTSIEWSTFSGCTGLISITIPNSVTSIGDHAFQDCTSLTSVEIPNSVTSIGIYAFSRCYSLTSATIPNSVTSIGSSAFWRCISLTSVTIPNSVTSIQTETFRDCYHLTSVTIPNSVTSIGRDAFSYCTSLTSVICEAEVPPTISGNVFPNQSIIYVPFGTCSSYKAAKGWKNYIIRFVGLLAKEEELGPTSIVITFGNEKARPFISSCGLDGREEVFPGNMIEWIGLEPGSDYTNVPLFIKTTADEYDTIHYSFKTSALELTTQPSKSVSSNTAILLAETNMADNETSCGFEWKRNDMPDDYVGNKVYCPVANGTMAGRLKNLKDDVLYKYRAFYQSAAGNMYYGDWQYIFTGDVTVEFEPVLYTYAASAVKENEATLKGYALAGSEDFTEQGFEYWAESRANKAPRHTATIGEHHTVTASGISMKTTLTDLDAGTVYRYRTYAKTGDQILYGTEMTFTTQGEYQEGQAIEGIHTDDSQATKFLHDGQIYILRGDHIFDAQGKMVK